MMKFISRFMLLGMLIFGVNLMLSCANEDDIDFNSEVVINGVPSYIKEGTAVVRKGQSLVMKFAIIAEEKDGKKVFMSDNDAEDYDLHLPRSVKMDELKEGVNIVEVAEGTQLKFNPNGPFTLTRSYSYVSGSAKVVLNNGRRLTVKYENYRFFTSNADSHASEYINISGTVEYSIK